MNKHSDGRPRSVCQEKSSYQLIDLKPRSQVAISGRAGTCIFSATGFVIKVGVFQMPNRR